MAFRLLRSLNVHHTHQLLCRSVTRRDLFMFKLFQNARRLVPFFAGRFVSTSAPRLQSSRGEETAEGDNEENKVNSEDDFLEK
jgi:hypothetical protein